MNCSRLSPDAQRIAAGLATLVLVLFSGDGARAGGFHYPDHGTVALGRGGAFVARADDPTALYHNPAGATQLRGTHIFIGGNLLLENIRFQRRIYQKDGLGNPLPIDRYPHDSSLRLPEIQNDDAPFLTPFIALTTDFGFLHRYNLVVMAGIYGPNSHNARTFPRYCKPNTSPCVPTDANDPTGIASPGRYDTVSTRVLVLYPSLGLAWEPIDGLSFGGVVQVGWSSLRYNTVISATPEEVPDGDIDVQLDASSGATPTGILGVHWKATEFLEFGASVRFGFTFKAKGKLCVGGYEKDNEDECKDIPESVYKRLAGGIPLHAEPNPAAVSLDIPKQWIVRTGARYVHRDLQKREVFDVELDFVWEQTSALKAFDTKFAVPVEVKTESGGSLFFPIEGLAIPHNWQDSWSLRLGGSYTFNDIVKDGALTLRTGVLYESRAAPKDYSRVDFLPHQRVGISIGAGFSWGRYEFNVGYFHLFHQTHNVAPPDGAATCTEGVAEGCGSQVRQVVPWASDGFGNAVGNGSYAMTIDEWTFSAKVRFGGK